MLSWSILHYIWPVLSDNRSRKAIYGLFLSGSLRQVSMYINVKAFFAKKTLADVNSFLPQAATFVVCCPDNLCKQIGPRSGQTKCLAWSGSKLFDIIVFLKAYFFKKSADDNKSMKNYPACKVYDMIDKQYLFISIFRFYAMVQEHVYLSAFPVWF